MNCNWVSVSEGRSEYCGLFMSVWTDCAACKKVAPCDLIDGM